MWLALNVAHTSASTHMAARRCSVAHWQHVVPTAALARQHERPQTACDANTLPTCTFDIASGGPAPHTTHACRLLLAEQRVQAGVW